MNIKNKYDYFDLEEFSWIANFGVVPLFLLAAFLLAPIALCFALRRFSVIAVLEAINISSNVILYSKFKILNLAVRPLFVKDFSLTYTLRFFLTKTFAPSQRGLLLTHPVFIFALFFSFSHSWARELNIILARGEQKEIQLGKIKNFSVGNAEVISYKYFESKHSLLIKGKKVGYTDFIAWSSKEKINLNIYVLSKNQFLKTLQLTEALKNLNLELDLKGPIINASGTVDNLNDYLYLKKLEKEFSKQIFFKVHLSTHLRNQLIVKVYQQFFQSRAQFISCNSHGLHIYCEYSGMENKNLIKHFTDLYKIQFIQRTGQFKTRNYRLKLKLLQLEKMNGEEIHLGLDQLQSSVSDLFQFGLKKLIDENILFFTKSQLELSSLAEPEVIITIGEKNKIEIGSQLPFQNIMGQSNQVVAPISWQFAGLKITTSLNEKSGNLFIKYETEFTRPQGESITGNKEVSSAMISPGVPLKIFQIGFQTSSQSKKGIPLLSDIPLLKSLFQSTSSQRSFKQLYGYILLEEIK